MKQCKRCDQTKSFDQFYSKRRRNGSLGTEAQCILCVREKKAQNHDPLKKRKADLKSTFGLTLEDYDNLLDKQNGKCAICFGPHRGPGNHFHVDHCHDTGKIRGLLCSPCNVGIGMLNHDLDLIQKAILYLKK